MQFRSSFPILIAHQDVAAQSVAGVRLRQIQHELAEHGWKTILVDNASDAGIVAGAHRGLAAIVFRVEAAQDGATAAQRLIDLMNSVHLRAPGLPIVALGESATMKGTSPKAVQGLRNLHSILYLYEDTASFLARQIMRAAEDYLDQLLPPFFKALTRHAERSAYSWHTPGHAGGVGFLKSPVGYALHEFFGENTLRSDLSISVPELGSLLDHTGPIKEAEAYAAQVFGADHTYFVTNGTSTANKIVWHSMAGRDDLVIVDRNCHKSLLHSLIMTGATPIYFTPARNDYGIIGPIGLDQFSPEAIRAKVAASPIARDAKGSVRIAVVTNSTYDGLCYNAEKIKAQVADQVDALHFDEAWYAYAAFHEFYAGRHAMGVPRGYPRADHTLVFATHSTHKLLAAFSQASMIHIQESDKRKIDTTRFNDAFMMHGSTSPHYGIIASLDVSSAMMEGTSGRAIVQETHDEAMHFRFALASIGAGFKSPDWWFRVWQPEGLDLDKAPETADWVLDPQADWHGFGKLAEDYVMLDPIKVTLLTPGLGKGAVLDASGIPAAVVSKYLWERGLVVEKTGLYSFLILFSLGITRGKWSSMVDALVDFKTDYDRNAPLAKALPSVAAAGAHAYAGWGLRDLCDALHACYRDNDTARAMNAMYTDLPEPAMKPCDAYDRLVHGKVEPVPIDELKGRITAVMLVPYPPGIPLVMPGERFMTDSIIEYLKFARDTDDRFPGFEADIHGLRFDFDKRGHKRWLVDCVIE
ncbi:arginine/lysine/ornithine decarboxylase [Variovorax sp. J22R133]|uniref:arginine/lysine/ornithine decarboxylase n=1 Tax=Variovorax brevis TaxID=3053503 RepID=UPI0025768919|nr:arginine/lysine/ornithine decarboxylase [Variovorax sp. J22R133]MDM0110857.1 arginine/lysine/ornithine decarboxylase [Variovorax sp. J22R133]